MIPQTPRHDFLHELHKLLRPTTYLEIGVQTGRSLAQAVPPTKAIAVDPEPQISVPIAVPYALYPMTSDEYFHVDEATGITPSAHGPIDLAFIDGMHLVEYALRDFMGVERLARPDGRTVVVFDDVLPYSVDIAGRMPLPGDWAGDVWKVMNVLGLARPPGGYRNDLALILVDVAPTGALVVLGLNPASNALAEAYEEITAEYAREFHSGIARGAIENARAWSVSPGTALAIIRQHLNITEA